MAEPMTQFVPDNPEDTSLQFEYQPQNPDEHDNSQLGMLPMGPPHYSADPLALQSQELPTTPVLSTLPTNLPKLPLLEALTSGPILLHTSDSDDSRNFEIHIGLIQHLSPLFCMMHDGIVSIPPNVAAGVPQLVEYLYRGTYAPAAHLAGDVDVLALARWAGSEELAEIASARLREAETQFETHGADILGAIKRLHEMGMALEAQQLAGVCIKHLGMMRKKWSDEMRDCIAACPEVALMWLQFLLDEKEALIAARKNARKAGTGPPGTQVKPTPGTQVKPAAAPEPDIVMVIDEPELIPVPVPAKSAPRLRRTGKTPGGPASRKGAVRNSEPDDETEPEPKKPRRRGPAKRNAARPFANSDFEPESAH